MKSSTDNAVVQKQSKKGFPYGLVGWIALCEFAGIAGSAVTANEIAGWYRTLNKPFFSPPNWIFGPVWILLYAMMGTAIYRISRVGLEKRNIRTLVWVFSAHLFVNASWSIIFFGFHATGLALADILLMWVMIAYLTGRFYRIDRIAAYLMIPYLAWVTFATLLNFAVWTLNP